MQEAHTTAGTVQPEAMHEAEPTALFLDAAQWVALSMIAVILLMIWKKVPAAIGAALDRKIAAIRAGLDEAAKLRDYAEALKTEYEEKAAAAHDEAKAILAHAHSEASVIIAEAKGDAEALVERRGRMAEAKIAAAERAALAEVRAAVAHAATHAAAMLIAQGHDAAADQVLVDREIAGLDRKLH